jgi:hypothetical protein
VKAGRQLTLGPLVLRRGEPVWAVQIPVDPTPTKRPRSTGKLRRDGTPFAQTYNDPEYMRWKRTARDHLVWLESSCTLQRVDFPVIAKLEHVFARREVPPAGFQVKGRWLPYPWPWTEGRNPYAGPEDLDNLGKAVLDALVDSGLLLDDRLVVADGGSRKVYAAEGELPCVEVSLWRA